MYIYIYSFICILENHIHLTELSEILKITFLVIKAKKYNLFCAPIYISTSKRRRYNLSTLTTTHYWQLDCCPFHEYKIIFLRIVDQLNFPVNWPIISVVHWPVVVLGFCFFLSNFKEVFIYCGSSLFQFFVF